MNVEHTEPLLIPMDHDNHQLPEAIDLTHHLSGVARARKVSPLKAYVDYIGREDMISLAGGLPHPDIFPFEKIQAKAYPKNSFPRSINSSPSTFSLLTWIKNTFTLTTNQRSAAWRKLEVPRYGLNPGDIQLATTLQYGLASGLPQLQAFMKEIVGRIYKPAYSNWAIMMHTGNSDAWNRVAMTLCDPGDGVLAAEWTYPSAMATANPLGLKLVPVPMDAEGIRSDSLLEILTNWNTDKRGMPRPRVLYTIPVGQNPTGATMHEQRKREIYQVCVDFDVLIVEDDPYYFLQTGPYMVKQDRSMSANQTDQEFLTSLAPSFLRFDYQGRVIRLDSFSKTLAPGLRLGWFTCHPIFAEKFERQGETSSQAPCGLSQALVTSLLLDWGFDGYVCWLKEVKNEYRQRRDHCIDSFYDTFDIKARTVTGTTGHVVYDVYIKSKSMVEKLDDDKRFPVLTFLPPTGGMFLWLQVNFPAHPLFKEKCYKGLEHKLWLEFAEAGVLVGPGNHFDPLGEENDCKGPGHFRLSFSNADTQVLRKAVEIIARVLKGFFFSDDDSYL